MDEFEPGHQDRVTVLHINFDGTRILTASIDHRVKIWNRDPESGEKTLIDTFTAHDADIRDAKWLHPTTGQHIVTIGNDLRCRVWTEDPSQQPNSGRRFKCIAQIPSPAKTPFVSLDLKIIDNIHIYLALIDRQGLLQIYEPSSPDELKQWSVIDQWHVTVPAPGRGDETSFRVRWDPNIQGLPWVVNLSNDSWALSLVVTAMNNVKIYRAVANHNDESVNVMVATKPYTFWEASELPPHPNLVRDVQWAPFNSRGHDLIATACKDGSVRIFEVDVTPNSDAVAITDNGASRKQSQAIQSQPKSSLTTAIAGKKAVSNEVARSSVSQPPGERPTSTRQGPNFPFKHEIRLAAKLDSAHNDAWAVSWDPSGQILMSGGADGVTKLWKKSIQNEEWKLFADQAVQIDEDDDGNEGGENGKAER